MPGAARLAAVAAHGLAGSRTDLPEAPLPEEDWFALVRGCLAADLVGFLAVAAGSGHLPVTAGQADEIAVLEAERAGLSLLVERRALAVGALLRAAGIDHRVIDGPARRLAYGEVAARHFQAVQLLVAPDRLDEAKALLGPAPTGAELATAEPRERVVLRSAVGAMGVGDGRTRPATDGSEPEVVESDLVRLLGPGRELELGGRRVVAATLEQQLVVACAEMIAAPVSSLVQLRDVAQITLSPGLDARAVRRLAETTHVVDAVADGIALAWTCFELADKTSLSVWAMRMGGSRPDRSAVGRSAAAGGRSGLAQRVFGRRVQAASADTSPLSTIPATGPGRSPRSTRRQP